MTEYRIEAEPSVDADIEAAFQWYEREEPGLGFEFIDELRHSYRRILNGLARIKNSVPALGEQPQAVPISDLLLG